MSEYVMIMLAGRLRWEDEDVRRFCPGVLYTFTSDSGSGASESESSCGVFFLLLDKCVSVLVPQPDPELFFDRGEVVVVSSSSDPYRFEALRSRFLNSPETAPKKPLCLLSSDLFFLCPPFFEPPLSVPSSATEVPASLLS
jgi:hypothetical protein